MTSDVQDWRGTHMILFHGSLLTPPDLRLILTEGLRPHRSGWAGDHIPDREHFTFAATRVTGSPGGDPMAFARGWPAPPRTRRDASGSIVVLDVDRDDVVGTIPNDGLARTFALRAALRTLGTDDMATVLSRGAGDVELVPVVTARPRDLPDDPGVVLGFRDDLRRARTARATGAVLKKYGVVHADDVEDLLDPHTRSCVLCVNGRASVALAVPGTGVRLPINVGGEEVPEATWRFLFRTMRAATATHGIDWQSASKVIDVVARLPSQAVLPRGLRADTLTAFIDSDLKDENVQVLLGAVPAARIRGAILVSPDGRRWAEPLRHTRRPADVVAAAVTDVLRGRTPHNGLHALLPAGTR